MWCKFSIYLSEKMSLRISFFFSWFCIHPFNRKPSLVFIGLKSILSNNFFYFWLVCSFSQEVVNAGPDVMFCYLWVISGEAAPPETLKKKKNLKNWVKWDLWTLCSQFYLCVWFRKVAAQEVPFRFRKTGSLLRLPGPCWEEGSKQKKTQMD